MELMPYYLGLALILTIVSIGLQRRTVWMWYLCWIIFYFLDILQTPGMALSTMPDLSTYSHATLRQIILAEARIPSR